MKALVQRVSKAKVTISGKTMGEIDRGLLVFLGVGKDDTFKEVEMLGRRILSLRIFSDEEGKMNLSTLDIRGQILLISQFTLYADTSRGNRPSFTNAAENDIANNLYEHMKTYLSKYGKIESGVFGADMQVELVNDGPVTIMLDTER